MRVHTVTNSLLAIFGTLIMIGAARRPTWTRLSETVEVGSVTLKLETPVDWEVGEEIALASTSYRSETGPHLQRKRFYVCLSLIYFIVGTCTVSMMMYQFRSLPFLHPPPPTHTHKQNYKIN